jgi:hypothetical protein
MNPNIIERLQEALAMCDDLRSVATDIVYPANYGPIEGALSNIEGVLGEILTMIDGR